MKPMDLLEVAQKLLRLTIEFNTQPQSTNIPYQHQPMEHSTAAMDPTSHVEMKNPEFKTRQEGIVRI